MPFLHLVHQLEYDFIVAAGADARTIQLHLAGADNLTIDAAGNLVIQTASGSIRFRRPVIYQPVDGKRLPVDGGFELEANNTVQFHIGDSQ